MVFWNLRSVWLTEELKGFLIFFKEAARGGIFGNLHIHACVPKKLICIPIQPVLILH